MKHFKNIFRTIFVALLLLAGNTAWAADTDSIEAARREALLGSMDSVDVSLLTCSPHEEVYSLYGHTALRIQDSRGPQHRDMVFNWGIFNFKKPHFVLRFIFGLTDYELGVGDFDPFCRYYERWGSSVTEQLLDLTRHEKLTLLANVFRNAQPENRVYRYNFFFDNCSTRPRDILEHSLDSYIEWDKMPVRFDMPPTFRDFIREKTRHHPWATFGNDLLLGIKADRQTTRSEQEFLPENLMLDLDHVTLVDSIGVRRPLVKERRLAVRPGVQAIEQDFPLSPIECAVALLAVSIAIAVFEWRRRRTFRWWDALLMLLTGLAGCVLTVMLFSQHPCTTLNLQFLLLNPLPLLFIPAVLRRRPTRYWRILLCLVCLFLIGGIFQHYAEGMYILALCLLIRFCSHTINEK